MGGGVCQCDRGEDGVMCCQDVNRLASCLADSGTHAPSGLTHALASRFTIWLQTEASAQTQYRKNLYVTGDGTHLRSLALAPP